MNSPQVSLVQRHATRCLWLRSYFTPCSFRSRHTSFIVQCQSTIRGLSRFATSLRSECHLPIRIRGLGSHRVSHTFNQLSRQHLLLEVEEEARWHMIHSRHSCHCESPMSEPSADKTAFSNILVSILWCRCCVSLGHWGSHDSQNGHQGREENRLEHHGGRRRCSNV